MLLITGKGINTTRTKTQFFMNNTNNFSARASFEIAKAVLYNSWIKTFEAANPGNPGRAAALCKEWVDGRKLSQSEIRLEVELNAVNNSFYFGVTPNQVNSNAIQFITEQRLNLQDSLIAYEYGVYVGNPASRTDTAFSLMTYGNTQNFTAPQAAAIDTTFFANGALQVKCNNDVVAPYRGLFNNQYRPQTQQTAALGAGSPYDQLRGAEDGLITQEPNLLLIGSKNYVPEIVLRSNLAAVGTFTRAILIYKGVLAQNSTVVN